MDNLFKRAKAFIGLEEGEEYEESAPGKQLEITSVLRGKKNDKNQPENPYDLIVHEPKVYEDSLNISANLRNGNPVIINLRHLEPSEGMRLIDFVCGTAYAIDGHMIKIGETIFLFTPNAINIVNAEERSSIGEEISPLESRKEGFFSQR